MNLKAGQRLGQFEIIGRLGEGGMATVYRARQLNIAREVAIKVMSSDIADDPGFRGRFEREAQAIATLSHPHILKLFDFGQQDGMSYLVMELLSGGSLSDLLNQGRLSLPRIDKLLDQIGSALDYAHDQGVIHRDLKPGNVLLDAKGNAILTDFGLARLTARRSQATDTGMLIGTSAYMSPEQWRGEAVSGQSDIYSFGVMLFEMLTGERPFKSDSVHGLMYEHLDVPPPLDKLPDSLPDSMRTLLSIALAKAPLDRFRSASDLASAFHQIINGEDPVWHIARDGDLESIHVELLDTNPPRTRLANPTSPLTPPISGKTATTPITATEPRPNKDAVIIQVPSRLPLILVPIASLLLVMGALAIYRLGSDRSGGATSPPTPVAATITAQAQIEPVAADEYMVLVAQTEQIGKQPHEASRFITANLRQSLETLPLSRLKIREYPEVITSSQQATSVARTTGATILIWGSTADDATEVDVQVGSLDKFPYIKLPEDAVRRASTVHMRLVDTRQESVAFAVLSALQTLYLADGNATEALRTIAVGSRLQVTPAMPVGNTPAVRILKGAQDFLSSDYADSVTQTKAALELDAANPLLYIYRGMSYARNGEASSALSDFNTAARLGPENWAMPLYGRMVLQSVSSNPDEVLSSIKAVAKLRPDDWFITYYEGTIQYFAGNPAGARTLLEQSLKQSPNMNFPYILLTVIALREGRLKDANSYLRTIVERFPDPTIGFQIARAAYGDAQNVLGLTMSAAGKVFLGQYEDAFRDTQGALTLNPKLPDVWMIQGFALCNLNRLDEAETAVTQAITLDPNPPTYYLLRAGIRRGRKDVAGSLLDIAALNAHNPTDDLKTLVSKLPDSSTGCQITSLVQ